MSMYIRLDAKVEAAEKAQWLVCLIGRPKGRRQGPLALATPHCGPSCAASVTAVQRFRATSEGQQQLARIVWFKGYNSSLAVRLRKPQHFERGCPPISPGHAATPTANATADILTPRHDDDDGIRVTLLLTGLRSCSAVLRRTLSLARCTGSSARGRSTQRRGYDYIYSL